MTISLVAHGQVNVGFEAGVEEKIVVKVMDQMGRVLRETELQAVRGSNIQSVDVNDLSAGIYIITVESGESGIGNFQLILQ